MWNTLLHNSLAWAKKKVSHPIGHRQLGWPNGTKRDKTMLKKKDVVQKHTNNKYMIHCEYSELNRNQPTTINSMPIKRKIANASNKHIKSLAEKKFWYSASQTSNVKSVFSNYVGMDFCSSKYHLPCNFRVAAIAMLNFCTINTQT